MRPLGAEWTEAMGVAMRYESVLGAAFKVMRKQGERADGVAN